MSHRLWIKDEAKSELRQLPGHVRQRIRRVINDLSSEPRPHDSRPLKISEEIELEVEVRRLRLEQWRVIYVVDDAWSEVGVLAVRKRPPYDYKDLPELLEGLE